MAVKIDMEACVGCGACVDVCPVNVLKLEGSKIKLAPAENCTECGACVDTCPVQALKL